MNAIDEEIRKDYNARHRGYKYNQKALKKMWLILSRTKGRFHVDEWAEIKAIFDKLEFEI